MSLENAFEDLVESNGTSLENANEVAYVWEDIIRFCPVTQRERERERLHP